MRSLLEIKGDKFEVLSFFEIALFNLPVDLTSQLFRFLNYNQLNELSFNVKWQKKSGIRYLSRNACRSMIK
ncbi:hypothetical protein [uncultured Metabacillus sp.]|uniref:hypothetical protein n=1 Tax=Metabacillus sp. Hm71 TaxID=3450743 RepID=UPI0026069ED5|nr:hypothetical protein [uncultured Metabacillus sp.]